MKEIVITDKNGITLNTKNTLVNDDIKIKIDNSLLGNKKEYVEKLPFENVKDDVIYEELGYTDVNILIQTEEINIDFGNLSDMVEYIGDIYALFKAQIGIYPDITFDVINEFPNSPIESDIQTFKIVNFYIKEDIPYLYVNAGLGANWYPLNEILYSLLGEYYENKGYAKTLYDCTTKGIYVTYKKQIGIKVPENVSVAIYDKYWTNYKSLLDKTVQVFNDNKLEFLDKSMFDGCRLLRELNCEKVVLVDKETFGVNYYDHGIKSIFPLINVTLPNCKLIKESAFCNCYNLETITIPNCEYICRFAFAYCSYITEVSLPKCTYIDQGVFYSCKQLKNVFLPICEDIVNEAFFECLGLTNVELPECLYLRPRAFYSCLNLENIHLNKCVFIADECFGDDWKLQNVYFGNEEVVRISGSSVFNFTENSQHYVTKIHVRSELVNEYENATNWAALIAEGRVEIVGDYTDD